MLLNRSFFMTVLGALLVLAVGLYALPAFGGSGRVIKQDTDGDGRTDRIARLDTAGGIVTLEIDTDGDGRMDTFQHYCQGAVASVERDTDADGTVDERDTMENGGIAQREMLDSGGGITGVLSFDAKGRPLRWRRDTTGDGRMDTDQHYVDGRLQSVTRDTTGDGRINLWQQFENEVLREQRLDRDGDECIDQIIAMDDLGQPAESRHDLDGDGSLETRQQYENGAVCARWTDADGDGTPEAQVLFEQGMAVLERRDTTGDGRYDMVVRFDQGTPVRREEDTDADGRMDRFTEFDAGGRPAMVREMDPDTGAVHRLSRFSEGRLERVESRDGRRITITRFRNDLPVMQTADADGDGRPEQTIHYDSRGRIQKSQADTNGDGSVDTWQFFETGRIARSEQDRDHDGRVDIRQIYADGLLASSLMDNDGDGRFETTVRLDGPAGSRLETHTNAAGYVIARRRYTDDVLRQEEVFDEETGRPVRLEEFNAAGRIVLSREAEAGTYAITWHYDDTGTATLAEKDTDGDGAVDTWFYYEGGRVTRVAEDRNRDGKPDLWEVYDAAEVMVSRSEDMDFDGTADIETRQ